MDVSYLIVRAYGQAPSTTPTTTTANTGISLEQLKNQTIQLQKRVNQIGNMTFDLQRDISDLQGSITGLVEEIDGRFTGMDNQVNELFSPLWQFDRCLEQAIYHGEFYEIQGMADYLRTNCQP